MLDFPPKAEEEREAYVRVLYLYIKKVVFFFSSIPAIFTGWLQ